MSPMWRMPFMFTMRRTRRAAAEPVFAALVGMYNRALEALSDGDAPPPFVFTYTPDAFLFG